MQGCHGVNVSNVFHLEHKIKRLTYNVIRFPIEIGQFSRYMNVQKPDA